MVWGRNSKSLLLGYLDTSVQILLGIHQVQVSEFLLCMHAAARVPARTGTVRFKRRDAFLCFFARPFFRPRSGEKPQVEPFSEPNIGFKGHARLP